MKINFTINCENLVWKKDVSLQTVATIVRMFQNYFYFEHEQHVLINFVEKNTMKEINWQHYPFKPLSRILTFPFQNRLQPSDSIKPWGEIYLCLPLLFDQCDNNLSCLNTEISDLLVHALLHLLGYHHQTANGWTLLKQLEQEMNDWLKKQSLLGH